jgi:acetyl-CoA carboxylase biotin carboxyl carrier protein
MSASGRRFQPELLCAVRGRDDGTVELRSPGVGLWRGAPHRGALVTPGAVVGELEILGVLHLLRAPAGAAGVVVAGDGTDARRPVSWGDPLVTLDPAAAGTAAAGVAQVERAAATVDGRLVFRAPSSGRYYGRPAPDRPAFVTPGDELEPGRTICLLEVMKTFNRVTYGGEGLPTRARVTAVVPRDGDDLEAGDVILELE